MDEINRRAVVWYFPKARVRYAEYRAFLNVLQILGTTCSRFFRKVIRETIQEGPDPLRNDLKLFRDALYQVAALGRNLNQLMRAFNAGLAPTKGIDAATLADLGDSVYRLRQELAAVILRSKHRWVNHD